MKRNIVRVGIIPVLLAAIITAAASQTVVTGNLSTRIDSLISSFPSGEGTNDYQAPTSGQLTQWGTVITKILQGDYSGANSDASALGYHLTQFNDNTTSPQVTYYILEKNSAGANHWGVFVFNSTPKRPKLVIQAPHPLYDSNTGKQGRLIFINNGARALFLSGTHRCNSSSFTTCSGTTTACSDTSAKYRLSDQAHVVNGTFQKTTDIFKTTISNPVFIQPHGFGKDAGDPDLIMSNGTRNTPATDYLVSLRNNLQTIDATLTYKIAHVDLSWTKLIATTNTQGRLINGSSSPCSFDASSTTGRFLHIEQAYSKLRDNETNRKKLSDAIAKTFPADTLQLTSPNGGETWQAGTVHSITWTATGFVSNVKLEYSLNNGTTWSTIAASASNTGSYSWTLPNAGTWRGRVRISDAANSATSDVSSSKFTISFAAWPISGTTTQDPVASAFGPRMLSGAYDFHRGFDLPNALNTPVHPVKPGVVVRREDTSVTVGTGLERYGNWILVKHESEGGSPRHTGYLHLNGFHTFSVGDTVSTADTIGFMGKSGVGINTIHTHLEYYKNLSGTSINNDKIFNPIEILSYNNGNAYIVRTISQADSNGVEVSIPDNELDFDKITLYGTLGTRTIGFNDRVGIDPADNDNPLYNNVFIDPKSFTIDSSYKRIVFWTKTYEVGDLDSIRIEDVNGYSATFVEYSGQRFAVVNGNWDDAIWATEQGGVPGSVSPPTQYDDVVINSGITVTVNSTTGSCRSIAFGDTSSHLSFAASSILNIYGNFTLASTSHKVFTSWPSGSKLRFAGSLKQYLNGWSTSSSAAANTTLMEVVVDKTGDTLKTPFTDMKLALGTSLEIVNGTFFLDSTDDINGKSFDGSSNGTPAITVGANGAFIMKGGASHIRSGSTGSGPIGKFTLQGRATLTSTTTLNINFGNFDVENGGVLSIVPGWSSKRFNPETLMVKSGGSISNSTTTNPWADTCFVILQNGGVFRTTSSTTIFPFNFTNLGTVRYARTSSGDQTVTDMNYHRLEVSVEGNNKVWTLAASRTIADSLEINNSATLVLTAASAQSLNLNGVLRLTSGTLDNSNANVSLTLPNDGLISRATGSLTAAPVFGSTINVRYSSTTASVTTGFEIPASPSVLKDVTIFCDTATVLLGSAATINGALTLSNGILDNSNNTLTFADGAKIRRATGIISSAPAFAGMVDVAYISTVSAVTTGSELPLSENALDTLSIQSPLNITLNSDVTVNGTLELSRGVVFLNDYNLTLDSMVTISGAPAETTMIAITGTGSMKKIVKSAPSMITFPVGDTIGGFNYTPVSFDISSIGFDSIATVGVRVLSTKHPSNVAANDFLNRYWIITPENISSISYDAIFQYDDEDVQGDESNILLGQWNGVEWITYEFADTLNNRLLGAMTGFSDFTGLPSSKSIALMDGWNLLSVPLQAPAMDKESLFPTAISSAYAFQGGYISAETLRHGIGYWVKFSGNQNVLFLGDPILNDTIDVNAGWNLVGSLSAPIPKTNVIGEGTGITSNFFQYTGSYQIAETLYTGKGYWVKVSGNGKLIFSSSGLMNMFKNELKQPAESRREEKKALKHNVKTPRNK